MAACAGYPSLEKNDAKNAPERRVCDALPHKTKSALWGPRDCIHTFDARFVVAFKGASAALSFGFPASRLRT